MVGGDVQDGKRIRAALMKLYPKYKGLVELTEKAFDSNGYVRGLDGRRIYAPGSYQALNYLIQGAEAVCFKVAMCKLHQELNRAGIWFLQVGWHHDELSIECRPENAQLVIDWFDKSLRWAGDYLGHRCPLAGEGGYGKNWSIH